MDSVPAKDDNEEIAAFREALKRLGTPRSKRPPSPEFHRRLMRKMRARYPETDMQSHHIRENLDSYEGEDTDEEQLI